MTCYTELDELQEALKRVKIDEDVSPVRYGMLVKEGQSTYSKMQKLLNCQDLQECHKYLYDLDPENLEDDEIAKIDKLFDLGVRKGYIDNSFEEEFEKQQNPDAYIPAEEPEPPARQCCASVPNACWTVLYSATKDGVAKCGECFSNSTSVQAAKADCLAKLARFGYENVAVLAIEAGDPDCACCNEDDMLKNRLHNAHVAAELEGVEENDMLRNRPHNAHVDELSEGEELVDEAGNPYAAGMKVVTGGKLPSVKKAPAKCVKEEDDEDEGKDEGKDDAKSEKDAESNDAGDAADDVDDKADNDKADDETNSETDDTADDDAADDDAADDTDDAADDTDDTDDTDDADDAADDNADDESSEEEISDDKKSEYKNEYKQAFKDVMLKCKFEDKSFNDLTIEQKVKFFETLREKWTKADPSKFMTPKEEEQLNAVVISNS